jgi:hypothetical protein
MPAKIAIPLDQIAEFCKKYHVRKMSLFGSVIRDDFRPESDVDVLVEFLPDSKTTLLTLAGMEIELSEMLGGRKVDVNTPDILSKYLRDEVLSEAETLYVAA